MCCYCDYPQSSLSSAGIGDTIGGMEKNYSSLKREAIKLRRRGLSYGEIRKGIAVSKSTLSFWLKDVPLKPEHKKRLYTKQIEILSRGPQSQKERRAREVKNIINKATQEIKMPLSKNTYRLMGAALYWAEGSKTTHFAITNSDPHLIAFMVEWFQVMFGIPPQQLKVHLNIYPQQNEGRIKKFWSDLTNIPLENFGKSFIKPPNKGFKKNNLYYGTISVRVMRGTDYRHRVFGWIQKSLQEVDSKVKSTQRKWESLTKVRRPPVNL